MKNIIVFLLFWGIMHTAFAQKFQIKGHVLPPQKHKLEHGFVALKGSKYVSEIAENGSFHLKNVPQGNYVLVAFGLGLQPYEANITLHSDTTLAAIQLQELSKELDEMVVQAQQEQTFGITRMRSVENFGIYEGKKTEVVVLKDITANLATNNPRQVYAKITGINIWESDGTGLQLGIGGRGLSPNRTSNFNTRQNGYDISADALGYPESYYTPPTEALERIEIIRGAASLQYGTQFGGMLNFRFKKPSCKPIEVVSRQSVGSWGFFGTFNSVSGTVLKNKLKYYAYYQYKRGEGYRPNSDFNYHNAFASVSYDISKRWDIGLEVTKMHYLTQQAGGLTDKLFENNPRQSVRTRNWFKVDWNLFALTSTYRFSDRTQLNVRNFALSALRQSVGNLERINVADNLNANRTLIDGTFKNFGNETRLLHRYQLGGQHHTFLIGARAYHGTTTAKQGEANNSANPDFYFLNPNNLENSDYSFPNKNYALFAESIINLSPVFSLTPGIRAENIQTFSDGYYRQILKDGAGNVIVDNKIFEKMNRKRNFVLLGLGASYKPNENLECYANFSQNYRAINFTDLRIVNPNFVVDTNIHDEKGYTADLGVRGHWQDFLTFEATAFYIAYNGRIGQVLRSDQPPLYNDYRYRGNIADARNIGLETFVEIDLLKAFNRQQNKPLRWSVFSNLSFVDARYVHTQEASIRNKKVEMVAPLMWRTGTTAKYKHFSSTLQFSYTAQQFSDATNAKRTAAAVEGEIPAYSVMDWSVSYNWRWFTLEGSCNNLLNAKYFTRRAESYPGPGIIPSDGRGFYMSVQAKF